MDTRDKVFVVLFEDNPAAPAGLRKAHMPDHSAFLEQHQDQVRAAGPLAEETGAIAGGLWVVTCDDRATVERLIRSDPFWPTGLRQSQKILAWHQVFVDGQRLIAVD